jgi:hypothetical protein
MSLTPVAVESVFGRVARQGVADEENAGLFDLIVAAAAAQASHANTGARSSGEQAAFGRESTGEMPPSLNVPGASLLLAAGNAQAQPVVVVEAASERASISPQPTEPDVVHRAKVDESPSAIRHGTLPVIVSGQLVELELLRERRRDTGPLRRLSMVLDSAGAGTVTVNASLSGERLVVEMDSAAGESLAARNEQLQEVQQLARRLGWQFTETVEESTR